jgi:hypothetical protein
MAPLGKLVELNISYSPTLKLIDEGAMGGLESECFLIVFLQFTSFFDQQSTF